MKTIEQKIFELVSITGEIDTGDLHIIDNTDPRGWEDDKAWRIYHKDGYCADVVRTKDEDPDHNLFLYDVYMEWEGFKKISLEEFYQLLLDTPRP